MSRPPVSVVMPFAGELDAARAALGALLSLRTGPGDELILADNSGLAPGAPGVRVVRARRELSPAHARNAGAEQARGEWILFLDADCRPPADLLERYFQRPPPPDVGALAGEVEAAPGARTLAGRYGERRSFLSQRAHLAHPFRPRAVAANLLVRRAAFEQIGGFFEGVRAAEDTDFAWRLQEAGWRLELRAEAAVEHRYRASVGELRRQWRGYAAGRAWLARRYEGFTPEPALVRALGRLARSRRGSSRRWAGPDPSAPAARPGALPAGRLERGAYVAIDALLAVEELAGFALSNRPRRPHPAPTAQVVLIAERFPAAGDPLVELATSLGRAHVEAVTRPRESDARAARELDVAYREDDGPAVRLSALVALLARHPLRGLRDLARRGPREPGLSALAPAVRRIEALPSARIAALGGEPTRSLARRLARLTGRPFDAAPGRGRRGGPSAHPPGQTA